MNRNRKNPRINTDMYDLEYIKKKHYESLEPDKVKSGAKKLREATPAQVSQRLRFSLMGKFIGKIKDTVNIGFTDRRAGSVAKAIQVNITQAMIGDLPEEVRIFYELITVSDGSLEGLNNPKIKLSSLGTAIVTWDKFDNIDFENLDNDRVYLLVFNESKEEVLYADFIGKRFDLRIQLDLPLFKRTDLLHCWIFLQSNNEKLVCYSEYLNNITITD